MPTLRSSSAQREISLRKQLLNKIFLQTLNHDPLPEPPLLGAHPLKLPSSIREQPANFEIAEQGDVEMKKEVSLTDGECIYAAPTEKQSMYPQSEISYEQCQAFDLASNIIDSQDSSLSMVATSPIKTTYSETNVTIVQHTPMSSKKLSKKSSKILARIEYLERSVGVFCEKENETPHDVFDFPNQDISIFQNIKTSQQRKKYEKFFKKALKVCNRLEGEISLYSQYVDTLETAVSSIKKGSKLYKMLEAKLRTAYKFQDENPSHEQLKTLLRQLKLVNLLLNKYEYERLQ
ncbi:hypothetical protein JTE90_025000 [Oedothorax gibbosus]|uniref:Uncharacterized protein n=1 Tax=Oedothorax gibbosus TaxID=931172 RepID=A0AAV6VWS3_9ARAC|nr:hypothetical protein JTE90_025000 [Oedothorax gibbosus]